ncbi:MAG: cysteine desulfurase [Magnetospirillum sp. WYHS-4]
MTQTVYLDHNATTPVRPEAAAAVAEALAAGGNASSVHGFGRRARRLIEEARERVAALVGAPSVSVVFTSGGTEANALALQGCGRRRIVASAVEHPSVLKAVPGIQAVPVDGDGVIDLEALDRLLGAAAEPALVSLMLANNETGVLQPVAEAARIARRHGALVHCDAVQAAGKIPVDMPTLAVDFLTLSAHKLGGPPGVGALVAAEGAPLAAQVRGGGQERGLRAGTENLPGIAGFGAAAAAVDLGAFARLAAWRDDFEGRARDRIPGLRIASTGAPRLPNTSCLLAPGRDGATQVMALDLAGVAVSAGAACSSGKAVPSPVLRALGSSDAEAASAIRVSLGWTSRAEDLEYFLLRWAETAARRAAA